MTVLSRMSLFSQVFIRNSSRIPKLCIQRQPVRSFRTKRGKDTKVETETTKPDPYEVELYEATSQPRDPGILGKYVTYTAVAIPAFFTGCAIWQYETVRKVVKNPHSHMRKQGKQYGIRDQLNEIWNQIPPARKLVVEIVAANVAIFMLWKVPRLYPVMSRYFLCMPTRAHSVLASTLSAFSHTAGFHVFANMYVLWSFSAPLCSTLGKEQFLAVYLAGGTAAGLTSSVYRVMSGKMIPSLGASGAILSLIAIVCLQFPDARISIAFVDQIIPHSFSAKSAIIGLIILDCVGIARGWRFLDHAGHLGGVLFGLFYHKYGKHLIWENYKHALLKKYHSFRNKGK
ncbi:presenilins-associated rhomboid-like protein, mitochondrial [Mercenaria mercenaria]|uniref:presenilins-associated rhomboid-like protein, mitochondrial n=1 Tax=Mercenaria mercenaria TaxID=6596 RepID=UPI001E1E1C43|nr:presenilins-associated rhomboid-like protein, mitochondrial [Mercenaria mercenaria]